MLRFVSSVMLIVLIGGSALGGPPRPIYFMAGDSPNPMRASESFAPTYRRTGSVAGVRSNPLLFLVAGGVMFDSKAVPCAALGRDFRLEVDASSAQEALVLATSTGRYAAIGVDIDDVVAIANFADDTSPVVVNLLGKLSSKEPERPIGLYVASVHPAFEDRPSGWSLIRADMLPQGLMHSRTWHSQTDVTIGSLGDMVRYAYHYPGVGAVDQSTWNLNDHRRAPEVCIANGHLTFSGTPRVEFVGLKKKKVMTLVEATDLLDAHFYELRKVDAEAFDAALEVYRVAALMRMVKAKAPPAWRQFIRSLPDIPRASHTPTVVCPTCSSDEIREWLSRVNPD